MNKCVMITGASRGIGAACAEAFAKAGCDVVINYNKNEDMALRLCDILSGMGVRVEAVQADVSDPDSVRAMFDNVYERFGFIDVLVNNAGIAMQKLLTDTTDSDWDKMISTDLGSVFYCSRAVLPSMIRQKRGCIVNIASMWGEVGASCEAAYSAAKAGVIGLTKALAKEVAPSGIRVNAVSPGVVMTDMMSGFTAEDIQALRDEIPIGELCTPGSIADAVVFLASDAAGMITGQVIPVNGGMVI